MPRPTHIVKVFKSQHQEVLYRAEDGVRIAQLKASADDSEGMIVFGEDPHKANGRSFISGAAARTYLRNVICVDDLNRNGDGIPEGKNHPSRKAVASDVVVDEISGEGSIILPAGAMELPGGIRSFN
jgi:hypothetical protein